MRIRASLVVGLFVSAFTMAAGIPTAVGASAPVRAAAPAATNPGRSLTASIAMPHQVDVRTLPATGPNTQRAPRLPLLVRDPAAYAAAKKSPKGRAGIAITRQAASPSGGRQPQTGNFIATFPGINLAGDANCCEPPDTQMAVGPNRVLEMVNSSGQVYDKAGNPIGSNFLLSSFFGFSFFQQFMPVPNEPLSPTDPRVLYDSSTGRWYASILGYNGTSNDSGVFLAISTTSDAAGVFNVYLIDIETGHVCDQPKLGYSSDKFVVGCSDFILNPSVQFIGAVIIVASKAEGLAGANITTQSFAPNASRFGLLPAQNLGAGTTAYIVFNQNPAVAAAGLITVTGSLANGSSTVVVSPTTSIAMNATAAPPKAAQKNSAVTIDTGDDRFMSAVVQGGALYTSGGESCTPTGDSGPRACLRMVEIGLAGSTLIQGATAGLVGAYVIDPTLGINASGELVLDYTTSSANSFPDLEVTFQPAGDPNTFVGGGVLLAGIGPYLGTRWGDYGAAAVDPAISAYIWVAGEYSNQVAPATAPSWATEIAEVYPHITECTVPSLIPNPTSPSAPGTSITLTASATCATGLSVETPEYQFWIKAPGGALTMVQDYSATATYNWSSHVTLGTYTLEVLVRATTETAKAWDTYVSISYVITTTPCTTPTLAANPSSTPQVAGTPVLLTATTTCGTTPLYQFWVVTPDHVLHMLRDYSTANTYNWTTLDTQIGSYTLEVLVKNTGSLGAYDAYLTIPYSMELCTAATLSTGAATTPYVSGSGAITLTAAATCAGGAQYEFWYQDPAGAFHLIGSGYGAATTAQWSADFKAGNYNLLVEVRPVGSTANFVTYKFLAFTLTGCGLPTLAPDKTSPQVAGTMVTWTATVTCSGTPNYKFYVQSPAGVFTLGHDWSATATFPWASPAIAGVYHVQVWVRNAGAVNDLYDNYTTAAFTLGLCDTPTLSTGAATSPYASGAGAITLTASANCAGGTQYEFWYQDPAAAFHLIGSGYGAGTTAQWSADFKAGSYNLLVEVRPVGSTASFVTYKFLPFTLTGCGVPTLTPDKASPQARGTIVTWTAVATCSGTANYKFYVQSPAGVFALARDWNATNTFPWTPTTPGTYHVQVWVRNAGAVNDLYDNYITMTFTIT